MQIHEINCSFNDLFLRLKSYSIIMKYSAIEQNKLVSNVAVYHNYNMRGEKFQFWCRLFLFGHLLQRFIAYYKNAC